MFELFFTKYPDYTIVKKPSAADVARYEGVLPAEILYVWRHYGYGIFADGYLRFVDPAEFQEFVDEHVEDIGFKYVPIAVSAFGDLFVWKRRNSGFLEFYDLRHSTFKTLSTHTGLDILFDMDFLDDSYIWEELHATDYHKLKAKLGVPAYDQCFGYVPLLALGGRESIDNVQIVDLRVHMDLMAQVSGPL